MIYTANEVDSVKVVISGDAQALSKEFQKAQSVMKQFGANFKASASQVQASFVSLSAKAKTKFTEIRNDVNKAMTSIKEDMKKGSDSANGFAKVIRGAFSVVAIKSIISFSAQASTLATELESSQLRVQEIFGQSERVIRNFAQNSAQNLGMSQKAAYNYASTYGNLFSTFTSSASENASLTTSMLRASAVVASKTGRTMQDVMERIRSGLLGNTEAIEDLGINVNVAMIETTEAFKKMADGRSWEQLSYQEQQQVRALAILEQAQKKYGNEVAQTSALSKAQTTAAIEDFKTSVGGLVNQFLIPALPVVTKFFTGLTWVASALNNASGPAKTLLAISGAFLGVMLLSLAATKIYALTIKGIAAMKLLWGAATTLLIPKVITLGTVLKAALGWIGLIAGAIGLFTAFFGGSTDNDTVENLEEVNNVVDNTTESATVATDAIAGLTKGLEKTSKVAKGLAGFDKINKISSSSSTSGSLGGTTQNLLDDYIDDIMNSQEMVESALMPTTQTQSEVSKAWNGLLEDVFAGNWSSFWNNWKQGASDIKNNIVGKIRSTNFGNAAYNMFSDLFTGDWSNFFGKWKSGATDIIDNIKYKISQVKKTHFVQATNNMFSDIFSGNWSAFFTNWKTGANDIKNSINQKIWGVDTATLKIASGRMFGDIFSGNWTTFWKNWKSGANDIKNNLSQKIFGVDTATLKTSFKNMLSDVFSGEWDNFWSKWKDGMNEIFSGGSSSSATLKGSNAKGSYSGGRFATGGVIDSPTVGLVGEAGREVIMPLENNTGWIREIAAEQARFMAGMGSRFSGSGNTNVYIGNDRLDSYIVKSENRNSKRGGGR